MAPSPRRTFPSITACSLAGRETQTIAADLDGTLLISPNSFPYFLLVAVEAGSFLRGFFVLLVSPLVYLLYLLVSDYLAVKLVVFVTVSGLRLRDIELVARTVLPRFYFADVREEAWQVFQRCRRRVIVTANLRVLVEPFAKGVLGAETVVGTELVVGRRTGRATGFIKRPGVMVGELKKAALVAELGEEVPDIGIGDREADHDFMAICKEGFLVHPDRSATPVRPENLDSPFVFNDGRLVQRPTPLNALSTYIWMPIGLLLATIRTLLNITMNNANIRRYAYHLLGIKLVIRGKPPPMAGNLGHLFVCNHRTSLDPVIISMALRRNVTYLTYSVKGPSRLIGSLRSVPLTCDMEANKAHVSALLKEGDLVIFPEETTCRESFLLRFSPLFAELSDRIVPVAVEAKVNMFHASSVRGWKSMDPFFFFMNPRPKYEVTFLNALLPEQTCKDGKTAVDIAEHVQRLVGATLGFECTSLTKRDKYTALGGWEEMVKTKKQE